MSAFTFSNKFSIFTLSLGLSLFGAIWLTPRLAIAFSLPHSTVSQPTSNQSFINQPIPIPISELPESVANRLLENASQTSGLSISELEITSVQRVTWPDGCMGQYRPALFCTMALVDGWIVNIKSNQQELLYHASNSQVLVTNVIIGDRPPVSIPGSSQNNPILPDITDKNRFIFRNVPSGLWYDPPTTYGFSFLTTSDSLFTEILDFPVGIDNDNLFTVSVGNQILGEFSPSKSVDFVALFGQGVSEFTITGIDPLVDATNPTAFPIKLAFNTETANFEMLALEHPQSNSIPESSLEFALLIFGSFGLTFLLKKQGKQTN